MTIVESEDGEIILAPDEMSTFIQNADDYAKVEDMEDEQFMQEYMPY